MVRVTATEAARGFSDVLSRVAAGEAFEITRNGAPVAILSPLRSRLLSADRFRMVMASAPPVDIGFTEDLRALRDSVGPPDGSWPS